jgi:hypothetical protein
MEKLPIKVGILSYRAPKTVAATLENYKQCGLFDIVDKVVVFFNGASQEDENVALRYGLEYRANPNNLGIQGGMRWEAETLESPWILHLENDCPMIVDQETAYQDLQFALSLLKTGRADMVRMRSRFTPGEDFCDVEKYTKMYHVTDIDPRFAELDKINKPKTWKRLLRPVKARIMSGRSLYIEKNPDILFPKDIHKVTNDWYVADSATTDWTHQSVLLGRDFYLRMLDYADAHPASLTIAGNRSPEKALNCRWWRRQHFKIAQGNGIFTHKRLDR